MAKKGSNGGGASKIYDPKAEAAALKAAQERKKRAAGQREVHNLPNLNNGLRAIAKREHGLKTALADRRAEQADSAMGMMPDLLPGNLSSAHTVFAKIIAQFRVAQPRIAQNGDRINATQVAIQKAKMDDRILFSAPDAERGIRAAKDAIWRAGTPNWEEIERQNAATRRRQRTKSRFQQQPTKRVAPHVDIDKLEAAVRAAELTLNIAKVMKKNQIQSAQAKLEAAQKALANARASQMATSVA